MKKIAVLADSGCQLPIGFVRRSKDLCCTFNDYNG